MIKNKKTKIDSNKINRAVGIAMVATQFKAADVLWSQNARTLKVIAVGLVVSLAITAYEKVIK